MILSIDCEADGLDIHHGSRAFFFTICKENGEQLHWEWNVNPLTRRAIVPEADVDEILAQIKGNQVVGQNLRFDIAMLRMLRPDLQWDWSRTDDTLIAGHLLASNLPHNLTDMVLQYLNYDIEPLEKTLEQACQEARRWCRSHLPEWRIAEAGLPEMPSAKEKCWKNDTWLPRTLVKHWWEGSDACVAWIGKSQHGKFRTSALAVEAARNLDGWEYRPLEIENGDHPWWTVLRDYANADSATTLALWKVMAIELERRGLTKLYRERMRLVPIILDMERRGVTVNGKRLEALISEYSQESAGFERVCVNIAAGMGYNLKLPKSGNSNSLSDFLFGPAVVGDDGKRINSVRTAAPTSLMLPVVGRTDTGAPSLDKVVLDAYSTTLPGESKAGLFIKSLRSKRKRDTAISYLNGYRKFCLPLYSLDTEWCLLHPSLNQTGTDTLRMSSGKPNSQSISKQEAECQECKGEGCQECNDSGKELMSLRYCFGPAPGREWWSLDAKNIELRIPAYISGEKELIELFERSEEPPFYGSNHLLNFSIVYPDIWQEEVRKVGLEKVGPHCKKKYAWTWYQWCKNGGLGIQYSAGPETADRAFHKKGCHMLLKQRFAKQERLNQECIAHANKYGYVETLPDRNVDPKHGYPILCTRTEFGKALPTTPLNYKVSGTACWVIARGMVKCEDQLAYWRRQEKGFDGFLALNIHDELVFDFPFKADKGNLPKIKTLQALMESCGDDLIPAIPLPVGIEYHEEVWSKGETC